VRLMSHITWVMVVRGGEVAVPVQVGCSTAVVDPLVAHQALR